MNRTETGQLMTSFRPQGDKQWDYLRPSEAVKKFLRFEERGPGIFELICLDGWPSKVMSNRPDGSYATKDLFMKHPDIEGYKYYARLDDTIVLVNGEKVNPLDLEGRVRQDDAVAEAVVFGAGRANIGLVIIRAPNTEGFSDEDIIDRIWPAVEDAHKSLPAYGQLSKSMVRVLPADTNYPRTDKGTVIRQALYRDYSQLIDETYEREDTITGSLVLSKPELKAFIRKQLRQILSVKDTDDLTDDTDFFGLGMDSLQATQLRSVIMKTLDTGGRPLGLNVAFEYPTINALAAHLDHKEAGNGVVSIEDQMENLISKYSQFDQHKPVPNGLNGSHVVSHLQYLLSICFHLFPGYSQLEGRYGCERITRKSRRCKTICASPCPEDLLFCARRICRRGIRPSAEVHAFPPGLRRFTKCCKEQTDRPSIGFVAD